MMAAMCIGMCVGTLLGIGIGVMASRFIASPTLASSKVEEKPNLVQAWVYKLKMHKKEKCKTGSDIQVIIPANRVSDVEWCKDCA